MKRLLITILFLSAVLLLPAQLYHPGEQLFYRVSYKAKMFPNTEVGAVEVKTSDSEIAGRKYYKVEGIGRTLPTYRWFFNLEDIYTVWIDPETKRPVRFESDLHEGDYTFQSYYNYDWENNQVFTRWRRRQKPYQEKTMPLTPESMDAIALFFTMRGSDADSFKPGDAPDGASGHDPAPELPLHQPRDKENPQHGQIQDPEVRMPAGHHRRILVYRRHGLHALDLGRREQNPALHRIARARGQHQRLYFGLQRA